MEYILFFIIASLISYLFFQNYQKIFKNFYILDKKNLNYAFKNTPTGSGIIFLIIFLIGNIFLYFFSNTYLEQLPNRYYLFLMSVTLLTIISFLDDRKSIDPIIRLLSQLILVYLSITSLNLTQIYLPDKLVFLITVCIWIYLINITNFIDGSDGFLISNFLFYCLNLIVLDFFFNFQIFSAEIARICLPFALIYLFFNNPKAKLFMGDAGSIFLGFLTGYFFLELIILGKWNIAISLLSYNLSDCTYCLLKKMKKGILPWVGIYDYYFLKPILKNKINHFNVFYLINFFWIINSLIIILQELLNYKFLFIFSIILSIGLMKIFSQLEKNFYFLKIKK